MHTRDALCASSPLESLTGLAPMIQGTAHPSTRYSALCGARSLPAGLLPMARMYMWPKRGDREIGKPGFTVRNEGTVMRVSLPQKASLSQLRGPLRP